MSENKVQNEQELWDVLSSPVSAESKAEAAPKAQPKNKEGRFAKPGPVKEVPKEGRKLDGFFYACMAGVAAVSVAVTLLVSSLVGGEEPKKNPAPVETNPGISGETIPAVEGDNELVAALELENAELRAQVSCRGIRSRSSRLSCWICPATPESCPPWPPIPMRMPRWSTPRWRPMRSSTRSRMPTPSLTVLPWRA